MGADRGNDSWETALLSLSFCCGHFETSGAICLAVRYAGGEEKERFYLRRDRRGEYARILAQTEYLSINRGIKLKKKKYFERSCLAGNWQEK